MRNDPRPAVADAHRCPGNNRARMDDPRYRRSGLPVTSRLVESLIGAFNARVKGRDKCTGTGRPGRRRSCRSGPLCRSEDGRWDRYFADRPGNPYRRRARAA
ncbi:MAG TPA: hypothetical protein VH092_34560 [Urbifossiella sp.]|jgi:hypothetical protein|nr:hypothetical protein [Urbifossiella sp.]